ncbi:MAG: PopZ family protein [Hoeflea sp.]|uniref:PopZ family protein n=1 Tax=Hoeflea sp. TaxID=1940281 RepID=UPI001E0B51BF|nr:PopZ family protein [Hoeflea sp.]MBU4530726.1 PopZ family protein [Alphaproteobacteria bacterium]MBU4544946.1 PopZ family protein [Alphaproteobacteria bacterium]MBU4552089.1 PopZ family protein [Alphaproteobacteria bacterium]MBV1722278.1 PopZ family protein [Hoeflea sp.]MBV1761840.1 PopZ family protein [Hoeflea sp.]
MGQAGAQREPSMEEILASIRRIIENNEPALDGSHVEAREENAHHFDADGDYAEDHASDEARNEAPTEIRQEEPVARPVSLAEVAALARAIPRHQEARTEEQASASQAPATPAPENPAPANSLSDMAEIDDAAAEELRDALMSNEPVQAPVEIETASAEAEQPEQTGQRANDMHSVEHQSAGHSQSNGQLVSLHTGEKVAAAFGELDAAIAAGQSRSFDEIAEEMLRPMLTQWLDDNLPTLVERLVREEIERVSRGSRR